MNTSADPLHRSPPSRAEVPGRRVHTLKVWSRYFDSLCDKDKSFELRKDDRGYRVGDVLHLCEYDPASETYSGYACYRVVTFVLTAGSDLATAGLRSGFVILGLSAPSWLPGEEEIDRRLALRCGDCKRSIPSSSVGTVSCNHDGTFLVRELP